MTSKFKNSNKIVIIAFLIVSWTACNQQTTTHIPKIEHIYTQYENGIPKEVGMLQNSVKQGLWVTFYPTGNIQSLEFYQEGKLSGPQRSFRENGQMLSYAEMRADLFHGKRTSFYHNGRIASISYWVNDSMDGALTEYSEEGEITHQFEYRKGELVRVIKGVAPFIVE